MIVQNFTTLETLEQARVEVEPYLNREDNSQVGGKQSTAITEYRETDQINQCSFEWRHQNMHAASWTKQDGPREVFLGSSVPGMYTYET